MRQGFSVALEAGQELVLVDQSGLKLREICLFFVTRMLGPKECTTTTWLGGSVLVYIQYEEFLIKLSDVDCADSLAEIHFGKVILTY